MSLLNALDTLIHKSIDLLAVRRKSWFECSWWREPWDDKFVEYFALTTHSTICCKCEKSDS